MCDFALCDVSVKTSENRLLMMQKMVVVSSFFNYECSIIVVSIIELTAYTLDGLIFGLCAFKYGFVSILVSKIDLPLYTLIVRLLLFWRCHKTICPEVKRMPSYEWLKIKEGKSTGNP